MAGLHTDTLSVLDFVKVGTILTVAVFAMVIWLVPVFWPFQR